MLPERATTADYNAIIDTLAEYWGERDMRARHHPMFIHEFGDPALVMRDGSGGVAAYLFGFVAVHPSWGSGCARSTSAEVVIRSRRP